MWATPIASRTTVARADTGATIVPDVFASGRQAYQYVAARSPTIKTAMLKLMKRRRRPEDTVSYRIARRRPVFLAIPPR